MLERVLEVYMRRPHPPIKSLFDLTDVNADATAGFHAGVTAAIRFLDYHGHPNLADQLRSCLLTRSSTTSR